MSYGYSRVCDLPVEKAVERVTEELAKEGFGVLTTIDVKATLKKKLDKDVRPHIILGACKPDFAHMAMEAEPQVSLLLPCNVTVREDDNGNTIISSINAGSLLKLVDKDGLEDLAATVTKALQNAVDSV